MKTKIFAMAAAGALAVVAASMVASAGTGKALGGGQTDVSSRGAGDTIAFTSHLTGGGDDDARGQVQYVDRDGGTGQGQTVYHGTVFCMRIAGNTAYIEGDWDRPTTGHFAMFVEDGGEPNQGRDMIEINPDAPAPDCSDDDSAGDEVAALARGNVQVMP